MMTTYRITSLAALVAACGGVSNGPAGERTGTLHENSQAMSLACVEGTTAGGWADGSFGDASGSFSVELDVTPASGDEDALVGLAASAPSTYADLAAIVRFNAQGKIDARDGASYRADTDIGYRPGEERHLRFDVDTVGHTYSVTDLAGEWGGYTVASGYASRSEQANVQSLAFYGVKVDEGGALDVCNVIANSGACTSADAGTGFVNLPFASQSQFVSVELDATPSAANIDAVLGVSSAAASAFDDIAAAVRFNPDGVIDVRDGDVYRPLLGGPYPPSPRQYAGGTTYHFLFLIDVAAHTYTVALDGGAAILQHLAFRSQQASTSSLGNLVLESDGDTGTVTRCNVVVSPARGATYMHDRASSGNVPLPLSDGRYLDVEPTEPVIYDAGGFRAGTAPIAGPLAVDAAGNLYQLGSFSGTFDPGTGPLTSAGGTDVYLVQYDPAFHALRASRFGGAGDDTLAFGPIVNASGDVLFGLNQALVRVDAQGDTIYDSVPFAGAFPALGPDGSAFWQNASSPYQSLSISKLDPSGNAAWTRVLPVLEGSVYIDGLVADATGGIVFAGEINGKFALGDGRTFAIEAHEDGAQTYIAKLAADGSSVYANATTFGYFEGLTADGLGNAAVAGTHSNGSFAMLEEYRPDGTLLREIEGSKLLLPSLQIGSSGSVVADWAGDLYWNFGVGPADYGDFFVKIKAP